MAKVKYPLLSGDARGALGRGVIFTRGGGVRQYFKPKNPNSLAQQAQREYFRQQLVGKFMNHGNQKNLDQDDHPQYLNQERGDARYLQEVPQMPHGGLSGLEFDDHAQYLTEVRGDARYVPIPAFGSVFTFAYFDHVLWENDRGEKTAEVFIEWTGYLPPAWGLNLFVGFAEIAAAETGDADEVEMDSFVITCAVAVVGELLKYMLHGLCLTGRPSAALRIRVMAMQF